MDLSIIILSYNSKTDLEHLLPSVFQSVDVGFGVGYVKPYTGEVIVVDNGSTDGTWEWLKRWQMESSTQSVQIIKNINSGFSKGNNLGIKRATGDYVLLLNPDTRLESNTLSVMLDFMNANPEVGISGCKLIKGNGQLDLACRRRFPDLTNAFLRLFLGHNLQYNYSDISEDQSMEVDSVVGAFLLIRRSVMDTIGLLDEDFFMYGEDLDWCWRCKAIGKKVWYYPKVTCYHFKGSASARVSFKALKWFYEAMWIFYKKHYLSRHSKLVGGLVWVGIKIRYFIAIVQNSLRKEKFVSKR